MTLENLGLGKIDQVSYAVRDLDRSLSKDLQAERAREGDRDGRGRSAERHPERDAGKPASQPSVRSEPEPHPAPHEPPPSIPPGRCGFCWLDVSSAPSGEDGPGGTKKERAALSARRPFESLVYE